MSIPREVSHGTLKYLHINCRVDLGLDRSGMLYTRGTCLTWMTQSCVLRRWNDLMERLAGLRRALSPYPFRLLALATNRNLS